MRETTRKPRPAPACTRRWRAAALALALVPGAGCGREFFRNWADQDVSEAVFEKSRDPRWRLDTFSIEPPALARFADPYDPDRPPAPPDDRAAEALAPVPQWPHHRLLVPVEGTGYADMLDAWQRLRPPPAPAPEAEPAPGDAPADAPRATPPPPPTATPSPFEPGETEPEEVVPPPPRPPVPNSGANTRPLSPILPQGRDETSAPPPDRAADPGSGPPQAHDTTTIPRDPGVHLAVLQPPSSPAPGEAEAPTPPDVPGLEPIDAGRQVPADPRLYLRPDLLEPSPEVGAADLASIINPGPIPIDEAEAAGLARDSRPYVITPEQALTLGLINNRSYQFRLEGIYLTGLGVTLQRFQFQPQFYAGLSPRTSPPGGFPGPNPSNAFTYNTRETGQQVSRLNIGTIAGVGKLLSFGTQVAGGFANETIINFTGQNFRRPSVRSFLPLTVVQPFLRDGGRAVTLEGLTQAERNLLYDIRTFARFRQQFFPYILAANEPFDFPGNTNDPNVGFLRVLLQLQVVENNYNNYKAFERILGVYETLALGAGSTLSILDVVQIESQYQQSRSQYVAAVNNYRLLLDQFKAQLGLPPDVPLTLDRSLTRGFRDVFDQIDRLADKRRADLERLLQDLPALEEVIIDGRPVLASGDQTDKLEDLLLAAERVALENRPDLMNRRAILYDAWRQLAVTANQLKGVFNVAVTNQYQTPPTTTNPFGFNDQAKQFSLVLNAELPLVRLAERNNYIAARIDYNRERRILMAFEDAVKLDVRTEVRDLQTLARQYEILKVNLIAALQQYDFSLKTQIGPPATGGGGGGAAGGGAGSGTLVLIQGLARVNQVQNQLIQTWVDYQTRRLNLYVDLGIMPYDEWEAFHELFPSTGSGPGVSRDGARPAAPEAPRAPQDGAP